MANCGKKVIRLNRHMVGVHGVSSHLFDMALAVKTNAADANLYLVCPICSFATTRLDRHMKNFHKYTGEKEEKGKSIVRRAKKVRSNVTFVICNMWYISHSCQLLQVSFDLQVRKRIILEGKSYLALAFSQTPKKPCTDEPSDAGQSLENNFRVDPVFQAAYRALEAEDVESDGSSDGEDLVDPQLPLPQMDSIDLCESEEDRPAPKPATKRRRQKSGDGAVSTDDLAKMGK